MWTLAAKHVQPAQIGHCITLQTNFCRTPQLECANTIKAMDLLFQILLINIQNWKKLSATAKNLPKSITIQSQGTTTSNNNKENSISYYVKQYLKKVKGYEDLILCRNKPGKLYEMAKVHTENVPLKIFSIHDRYARVYASKGFGQDYQTYIQDNYSLRSTKHFIDNLKQASCSKNNTIVSLNVMSLFTNVTIKETL